MSVRNRTSRKRELQDLAREYRLVHGVDEIDPGAVVEWAIKKGWRDTRPVNPAKRLEQELRRALGAELQIDPQGREVRANVPVIAGRTADGQYLFNWMPIFSAKPKQFHASQTLRRGGILADCRRHKRDTESYNDNNIHRGYVAPNSYDFDLDLDEENLPRDYPDAPPAK